MLLQKRETMTRNKAHQGGRMSFNTVLFSVIYLVKSLVLNTMNIVIKITSTFTSLKIVFVFFDMLSIKRRVGKNYSI